MKLWYQSMSRQTVWGGYSRVCAASSIRCPIRISRSSAASPRSAVSAPQYRYLEYLETAEVMENVHRAMERKGSMHS